MQQLFAALSQKNDNFLCSHKKTKKISPIFIILFCHIHQLFSKINIAHLLPAFPKEMIKFLENLFFIAGVTGLREHIQRKRANLSEFVVLTD